MRIDFNEVGCDPLDGLGVAVKVAEDRSHFLDEHHLRHVQASVEAVNDLKVLQNYFQGCSTDDEQLAVWRRWSLFDQD